MKVIDDAFKDAKILNKASSKPMIEMVIPSSLDPTIAPKGCKFIFFSKINIYFIFYLNRNFSLVFVISSCYIIILPVFSN